MLTQQEERDLYQYSEYIVKRYLKFYAKDFRDLAMDFDDLKQEAHWVVANTIKHYKNKPFSEVKKLTSKAVGWKLNLFRRDIKIEYITETDLVEEGANDEITITEETNKSNDIMQKILLYTSQFGFR